MHGVNDLKVGIYDSTSSWGKMIVLSHGFATRLDYTFMETAVMKVLAIGSLDAPLNDEQKQKYIPTEVPATLQLYLDGKIEQFWFRQDAPGVVFLLSAETIDAAAKIIGALPLTEDKLIKYDYMVLGPLAPLGSLIK
jgi:hypothetical protein